MDDLKINFDKLTDEERTQLNELIKGWRDKPDIKILPIDLEYGPGAPPRVENPVTIKIDTKALARELIDSLFVAGSVAVLVIQDHEERDIYLNAHKAFSALHDILWGEFYESYIHHGDCSKFKTPYDAIDAYRKFIADCIGDRGIGELI